MKFNTIKIFHAKTTERKQENHKICEFPKKKETKFVRVYYNSATTLPIGHEVKLAIRILHLSAKLQVLRKSQHSSLSHYFTSFQRLCTTK